MAEDQEKLGEAIVEIRASIDKLKGDLDAQKGFIKGQFASLGTEVGGMIGKIAAGFTLGNLLTKGISGMMDFGRAAVENAGHLVDLSHKTGASIQWLQQAGFVARQTGTDVDAFSNAMFKLAQNIAEGTPKVRQGLKDMGLEWANIRKMKPEDQFDTIAAALKNIQDPQERIRLGVEVFGKSVGNILPAIVDDYTKLKDEAPRMSDAQIQALDRAADRWDKFKDQVQAAIGGIFGDFTIAAEGAASGWSKFFGDVKATMSGGLAGHREYIQTLGAQAEAERKSAEELKAKVEAHRAAVPVQASYTQQLAAARKELADLTGEQRKNLNAAIQMGATNEDLLKTFDLSAGAVTIYKDQLQKSGETTKKAAEAAKKLAEANATLAALQAGVNDEVRMQILLLEEQGLSVEQIATKLGLYGEVVKRVLEAEKLRVKGAQDAVEAERKAEQDRLKIAEEAAVKRLKLVEGNFTIREQFEKEADEAFRRRTEDSYDFERQQIDTWMIDEKKKVDQSVDGWQFAFDAIESAGREKFQALAAAQSEATMKMAVGAQKINTVWVDVLEGLPGMLQNAFSGGGNWAGFGKALGSKIGGELGKGFATSNIGTKLFGHAADGIGKLFGNKLGNMFAMAVPGIGTAIGAIVGPLLGKLGAGIEKVFGNKAKKGRESFAEQLGFGDLGGLYDDLRKLGGEGEKLRNIGLNVIGRNDEAGNKQWMEDVKKFYDDIAQKKKDDADFEMSARQRLQAAVEKYGFTLAELGEGYRAQLISERAEELIKDFTVLKASGIEINTILTHMGDAARAFVTDALKTGTEVPMAMKPMLQQMVDAGQLFDLNGELITDLNDSGIKFAETMTEGFDKVVTKLEEVVRAITGQLGPAIANIPSPTITPVVNEPIWVGHGPGMQIEAQGNNEPSMDDYPQLDKGGFANWGAKGTLAVLHNEEAIMPIDRLQSMMGDHSGGATKEDLVQALKEVGLDRPNINFAPVLEGALANEMDDFARRMWPVLIRALQNDGPARASLAGTLAVQ